MFRTVLILAILAFCAFTAGWFTIDRNEKETTIRFDRNEIRADASKAIAKGREILNADASQTGGVDQYTDAPFRNAPNQAPQYSDPGSVPSGDAPQQATRPVPPWELPPQVSPGNPPVQY